MKFIVQFEADNSRFYLKSSNDPTINTYKGMYLWGKIVEMDNWSGGFKLYFKTQEEAREWAFHKGLKEIVE